VADLVLRNVQIVELGRGPGWAGPVDLIIEQGVVRNIGHELERPLGLEEYDAGGRWVIPGLWDAHVHLAQWTARGERLDLSGSESPEHVLTRVRHHLAEHLGPLVGYGHRLGLWQTEPTVAALDAVAPDVPVVLIAGDAHHAWLNSRALERLGLPPREGVVAENEWYEAYTRIEAVLPPDVSPPAYRRALDRAAAMGITGLVDLERGQTAADWEVREPPIRVRVATYADGLDATIRAGLRSGDPLPGSSELVTMGPLKIISDGSLNTRTAWCCEEYTDGSGAGAPNQSSADLVIGMSRRHVAETAVLVPDAWTRAFTLKELVRRGDEAGPRRRGQPLDEWLADVHWGRKRSELVGRSRDDDIADPVGQPRSAYERTAKELDQLLERVVTLIWGKQ